MTEPDSMSYLRNELKNTIHSLNHAKGCMEDWRKTVDQLETKISGLKKVLAITNQGKEEKQDNAKQ